MPEVTPEKRQLPSKEEENDCNGSRLRVRDLATKFESQFQTSSRPVTGTSDDTNRFRLAARGESRRNRLQRATIAIGVTLEANCLRALPQKPSGQPPLPPATEPQKTSSKNAVEMGSDLGAKPAPLPQQPQKSSVWKRQNSLLLSKGKSMRWGYFFYLLKSTDFEVHKLIFKLIF